MPDINTNFKSEDGSTTSPQKRGRLQNTSKLNQARFQPTPFIHTPGENLTQILIHTKAEDLLRTLKHKDTSSVLRYNQDDVDYPPFRLPSTRAEYKSFFLHFGVPRPFYKSFSFV